MREQGDGPLWADGEMLFRVSGCRSEPDRLVKVDRPFAVVGRAADSEIALADRDVSLRHVYLHLDSRGVYAVDLVTRTGTRFNGEPRGVGWLTPGHSIEVAGRRIELVRIRRDGTSVDPALCSDDLLTDRGQETLAAVTLEPLGSHEPPWVLGSELVFLGWSAACGIQIKDSTVARTHSALVRTESGAYLVNLSGRETWVEDRLVRGATALRDGDLISIGTTQFTARVTHPKSSTRGLELPQVQPDRPLSHSFDRFEDPRVDRALATNPHPLAVLSIDPALIPSEVQAALIAWMLGTIQGGQGEMLRRQDEFHHAMTSLLRQIQQDNTNLLNSHLRRIEVIDHELAALRGEIARRNSAPLAPVSPNIAPLRIRRPNTLTDAAPSGPNAPTSWLLNRVHQLEDENRSAWKDLLGRLSTPRNPP